MAMASARRDHLVETALTLLNEHGFHATGIDRILAESGVARMTLYNHFKSKDELILAALRLRDERFRILFTRRVERASDDGRERLLAIFDVLGEWFEAKDFRGCTFMSAAAEYKQHDHPIHAAAAEHKRLMLAYVKGLVADAGAEEPEVLARQLSLLMEGAVISAFILNSPGEAQCAREAAEKLIDQAIPKSNTGG